MTCTDVLEVPRLCDVCTVRKKERFAEIPAV